MYFSTMSASCEPLLFQATHLCHSVFSCLLPDASFQARLVASEKVATRLPPEVERTSGSLPRFPINVTLFKLRLTVPPGECCLTRGYCALHRPDRCHHSTAGRTTSFCAGRLHRRSISESSQND